MPDKQIPLPPPPTDDGDDLATKESQAFANERNLKQEAEEREHDRKETLKDILLTIVKVGIFVVAILLIIGVLIWGFHLLAPERWHWLTKEQLFEIQKVMTSALLALVVSDYSKKYF